MSRQRQDDPMRLLVLGDFSGRLAAERPALASRPTHRVDADALDDVMNRLGPRLSLAAGDIDFATVDDFHPDRLYSRLDRFAALREARRNPQGGSGDLGRLLGDAPDRGTARARTPASGLEALIHDIVAPHIVADISAQAEGYRAAVDAAIAEQMRSVLHTPAFQSLEAAWRGVHWLISSLELDENLQLHLLDVTREELLADILGAQGNMAQAGFYLAAIDRWRNVPGAHGWSAIAALFQFGPSDADIGLLAALGLAAAQAGAPLLAGADVALAGDDASALAGWHALRRSEVARWIALAAPRVLLRLPYGKATDPIESFAFEEFAGAPAHEALLWGNASLALALLVGRAFTARGWDMELGDEREIGDLPVYTFVRNGEREMQACGEHFLPESRINALLNAGLVPIASRRDRNAVVAVRFQSVSDPAAPLAW